MKAPTPTEEERLRDALAQTRRELERAVKQRDAARGVLRALLMPPVHLLKQVARWMAVEANDL